jgi:hypothetical protein
MSEAQNKVFKPWMANLIIFILEIIEVLLYFAIAGRALREGLSGDLSGAFAEIEKAMWFLNISAITIALLILFIKPLRTPMNKGIAYWNLIWVAGNLYCMYA